MEAVTQNMEDAIFPLLCAFYSSEPLGATRLCMFSSPCIIDCGFRCLCHIINSSEVPMRALNQINRSEGVNVVEITALMLSNHPFVY